MSPYSSIPHDRTDAYKFSGFVASPPPVGNATFTFYSSRIYPCLCPPSFPTPNFLTMTCPHLSSGLVPDVGKLPSSSVSPFYSFCLCPPCSIIFLGSIIAMKPEVPLVFRCFLLSFWNHHLHLKLLSQDSTN